MNSRPVAILLDNVVALVALDKTGLFEMLPGAELIPMPQSWRIALSSAKQKMDDVPAMREGEK